MKYLHMETSVALPDVITHLICAVKGLVAIKLGAFVPGRFVFPHVAAIVASAAKRFGAAMRTMHVVCRGTAVPHDGRVSRDGTVGSGRTRLNDGRGGAQASREVQVYMARCSWLKVTGLHGRDLIEVKEGTHQRIESDISLVVDKLHLLSGLCEAMARVTWRFIEQVRKILRVRDAAEIVLRETFRTRVGHSSWRLGRHRADRYLWVPRRLAIG
jgi:hypothetical protein